MVIDYGRTGSLHTTANNFGVSFSTARYWCIKAGIEFPDMRFKPVDPVERFWKFVDKTPTCWLWCGSRHKRLPYGKFTVNGKTVLAHRFSWELHNGPIPSGLMPLHKCDNPPCIRPDHLFLGNHKDNSQDMVKKGRESHHWKGRKRLKQTGEQNGAAKLKVEEVLQIRKLYRLGGWTHKSLAKQFGVAKYNIFLILHHKKWLHV